MYFLFYCTDGQNGLLVATLSCLSLNCVALIGFGYFTQSAFTCSELIEPLEQGTLNM